MFGLCKPILRGRDASRLLPRARGLAFLLAAITLHNVIGSEPLPIKAIYERFGSGNEPGDKLIVGLKFEEVQTGKIFPYHAKGDPRDAAASMGSLLYEPVFSPGGQWTFLPVGPFDGFWYFPTAEWKASLIATGSGERFYASSEFGPALAHRFVKWLGPDEVLLSIGTGEDMSEVAVNLRKRQAAVTNGNLSPKWLHFSETGNSK